jgi:beta-glucanase (GH16 family)
MMNRFALALLVATLYCSTSPDAHSAAPEGWTLTFEDTFDGDRLDTTRWVPKDFENIVRNNELQAYVPASISVAQGVLRLEAVPEKTTYFGKELPYRSGMVTTKGMFSQAYGRWEIRCRLPQGKGLFPAFWLLQLEPAYAEIDVVESLGHSPQRVFFTHHWKEQNEFAKHGREYRADVPLSDDFHVYTLTWERDLLTWSVDGVERFRSETHVPEGKAFMLINLAVGGNWPGSPDATTQFPAALEVDYVRVYARASEVKAATSKKVPDKPAPPNADIAPWQPAEDLPATDTPMPAPAFRDLFNGKDLTGWVNVNTAPDTWTVKDGLLVCSGKPIGVMRSDRQYENFILHIEWRHMQPGGNSGVFVWSDAKPAESNRLPKGMEVQMLDLDWINRNPSRPGVPNHVGFVSGELFGAGGMTAVPDNPRGNRSMSHELRCKGHGNWNVYDAVCVDGTVKLAINGKFVNSIRNASVRKGYLCLESEGSEIHFRSIRILELPPGLTSPEQIAEELP